MKIFCMWPAAIALNYSVNNIWNNVGQIIYIYIYIKSQINSLVWGSLMLALEITKDQFKFYNNDKQ